MNDEKLKQIQKLLDVAEGNLHSARNLLLALTGDVKLPLVNHQDLAKDLNIQSDGKIIEGIFDGLEMVAPDGKKYAVPANYASKSKLIEGDALKLAIAEDGSFIYKQIGPAKRKRLIGVLTLENGEFSVVAEGKKFKVLSASVTYYKGQPGNRVTIIVPKEAESDWAAFEGVIHDHAGTQVVDNQNLGSAPNSIDVIQPKIEATASESTDEVITPEQVLEEETTKQLPEDPKREELPPENEEALKAIRQGFSGVPKKTDDAKVETAEPAASVEEALESDIPASGPQIIKHGTELPDEEPLVRQEKETNAIGEIGSGQSDDTKIRELEI